VDLKGVNNHMNCGKWKVSSNPIGGVTMYAVYRIRDLSEVDHSGNREYATGWMADKQEAQKTADRLNCCIEGVEP
jgi:hypothetical protein